MVTGSYRLRWAIRRVHVDDSNRFVYEMVGSDKDEINNSLIDLYKTACNIRTPVPAKNGRL